MAASCGSLWMEGAQLCPYGSCIYTLKHRSKVSSLLGKSPPGPFACVTIWIIIWFCSGFFLKSKGGKFLPLYSLSATVFMADLKMNCRFNLPQNHVVYPGFHQCLLKSSPLLPPHSNPIEVCWAWCAVSTCAGVWCYSQQHPDLLYFHIFSVYFRMSPTCAFNSAHLSGLLAPSISLINEGYTASSQFFHTHAEERDFYLQREKLQIYELCEGWAGHSDAIPWKQAITFIGTAE